jgi:large subunit ribosomal protein L5
MKSALYKKYREQVVGQLIEQFKIGNINAVPKVTSVVINGTTKEAVVNGKVIEKLQEDLTAIAGQKAVVTRAKKSISSFKLREGLPLGAMVTLRGDRMYHFLSRLIHVALPRVRDFRGLKDKSFDGRGNYTLGIKEQIIFPEINYDKIDRIRGFQITIKTSAKNDEQAMSLLKYLGLPFRN